MKQLTLIQETPIEMLIRENKELRASMNKMRKALFGEISSVKKTADYGKHEVDTLKQALCRTTHNDFADLPLFSQKVVGL